MKRMAFDHRVADYFFDEALIPIRLAVSTPKGYPAIVSLWSTRENGKIYCATKEHAYVVDKIRQDSRVAFELSCEDPPYRGVRGWADARIVPERGEEILTRLIRKFLGSVDLPLARELLAEAESEVAIELTPVRVSTWDYSRRMKGSVRTLSEGDVRHVQLS